MRDEIFLDGLLGVICDNAYKNPNQIIVRDIEQDWTWQSLLNAGANYANALKNTTPELPKEAIVPVFVDRSGRTVSAILGIMLSGRAYAPLSMQQPIERIKACLSALEAEVFIDTGQGPSTFMKTIPGLKRIHLKGVDEMYEIPKLSALPQAGEYLYVLFTSGSTGVPKGVLADHANIINTLLWAHDILEWHVGDVMGCATNFFFDISQFDLFTSLCFNVPMAIYSSPNDVGKVVEQTEKFGITSVFSVPAFFSQLLRHQGFSDGRTLSLRRIISGGDFFPPNHVLRWLDDRPDVDLYNVWGPTETSIVNTMHLVTEEDRDSLSKAQYASVGRAHGRMPFVLLDESGHQVTKAGERGEICMLGDCVTRGYLNNPHETRRAYFTWAGKRAFRTRDIGCQDEDGNLYIIGRAGSTVKISGYRVDLGEVEKAALSAPSVHQAGAFTVKVSEDITELWIAIEPLVPDTKFDIFRFKKGLREQLPHYMVPKRVIVYPAIPKNENGKVDRRILAERAVEKMEMQG